jgi:hypothetical protein
MKKDLLENFLKDFFENFEPEITSALWLNIQLKMNA